MLAAGVHPKQRCFCTLDNERTDISAVDEPRDLQSTMGCRPQDTLDSPIRDPVEGPYYSDHSTPSDQRETDRAISNAHDSQICTDGRHVETDNEYDDPAVRIRTAKSKSLFFRKGRLGRIHEAKCSSRVEKPHDRQFSL